LRKPQYEAFERFHQLILAMDRNLSELSQQEVADRVADYLGCGADVPADILFDLATGVGKTRLMGACLVYLAKSGQTRNCLVLAPRVAILDKLKRECDPASPKYFFVDRSLVPNPNVCFSGDLLSFEPSPTRLNVFVISPQTLINRRIATAGDFGPAIREHLTRAEDLVVFSDEAHHINDTGLGAWKEAVASLEPKLHVGFTATAPKGSEKRRLYSYPLSTCLKEGKYTKAVKLWVEPKPADIGDESWDEQTINFALQRLEAKQAAIAAFRSKRPSFPDVKPVLLIAAKDIEHAEKVGEWLRKTKGLPDEEVLVAHSRRSDAAGSERKIGRLVAIDQPGNRVRVVVNVFQLSEGWDVTNVWVIAPLRSLATFANAIQTIGRGLRLPAGRRVEDDEIDSLDVLCFGKEDFGSIVAQATKEFGEGPDGSAALGIVSKDKHRTQATRPVLVSVARPIAFSIPDVEVIRGEVDLNFSAQVNRQISSHVEVYDVGTGETGGDDGSVARRDFDAVIRSASAKVVEQLRFLDPVQHGPAVEKIARGVLATHGGRPGTMIATDATKLALGIAEVIRAQFRQVPSSYKAVGMLPVDSLEPLQMAVPVELDELPSKDDIGAWQ
jgi:type III restriction enzyme